MSNMQEGHQIKPVAQGIALGRMLPEAGDLMSQALEEWEKFKVQVREHSPEFAQENEVSSFAYWLFRWSGLIQYNTGDKEE